MTVPDDYWLYNTPECWYCRRQLDVFSFDMKRRLAELRCGRCLSITSWKYLDEQWLETDPYKPETPGCCGSDMNQLLGGGVIRYWCRECGRLRTWRANK